MIQVEVAAMPMAEDADHRQVADELDRQHPNWLVIWGEYTHEFVAFPLFQTPGRTILHAQDPQELAVRMRRVEELMTEYRRTGLPRAHPDL